MNSSQFRFSVLCSLLFLLTPFVVAETIRFDPPNPSESRSVDAIVSGVWRDGCLPLIKSIVIASTTITLHFDATPPKGVFCSQATTAYSRTFHMGVLPTGGYTVIAVADQGGTATELARGPLIVRDTETLKIAPYAVPASGGQILIANPFFLAGATITIGGVTVPANSDADGLLIANAPAHAPGAVDVAVNSSGASVTAKAALIYYDPSSADPAVFEPILFPLSFQGPGAFGSQWTTESFIYANGSPSYFRDVLPCDACASTLSFGTKQLTNDSNPWGHVLYAMRGTTGALDFASRIRDTSRQTQTAGTEVPVVRERDFRGQIRFLNLPVDARYRATLRLWSLGDHPQFIVGVDSTPGQQVPLSVTRIPGTAMWFGSLDVSALLTKGNGNPTSVMVSPASYFPPLSSPLIWGMLSITNNDTQQVTIVSPQ
jgi:hypothetical protein